MARVETWVGCDLDKAVQVRQLGGFLFTQDNEGNLLGAKVTQDGEPVNLTGTVVGYAILADGQTVDITGDSTGIQNGNEAYIILPQLAYSVPGQISIVIKLTTADTITTLAAFCGYVYRSKTGNEVVPPGTPIPDLSTLEEAIRNANTAATAANTAAAAAENVDISMSQDGDVVTITTTDRQGETKTATLTDQSEAVSELKSATNQAKTNLNATFESGRWNVNSVNRVYSDTGNSRERAVVEVFPGCVYEVVFTSYGASSHVIIFADQFNQKLSSVNGESSRTNKDMYVTAPAGAKYLYVTHDTYSQSAVTPSISRVVNCAYSDAKAAPMDAFVDFMGGGIVKKDAVTSTHYNAQITLIGKIQKIDTTAKTVYIYPVTVGETYNLYGTGVYLSSNTPIAVFSTSLFDGTNDLTADTVLIADTSSTAMDYDLLYTPASNGYVYIATYGSYPQVVVYETAYESTKINALKAEIDAVDDRVDHTQLIMPKELYDFSLLDLFRDLESTYIDDFTERESMVDADHPYTVTGGTETLPTITTGTGATRTGESGVSALFYSKTFTSFPYICMLGRITGAAQSIKLYGVDNISIGPSGSISYNGVTYGNVHYNAQYCLWYVMPEGVIIIDDSGIIVRVPFAYTQGKPLTFALGFGANVGRLFGYGSYVEFVKMPLTPLDFTRCVAYNRLGEDKSYIKAAVRFTHTTWNNGAVNQDYYIPENNPYMALSNDGLSNNPCIKCTLDYGTDTGYRTEIGITPIRSGNLKGNLGGLQRISTSADYYMSSEDNDMSENYQTYIFQIHDANFGVSGWTDAPPLSIRINNGRLNAVVTYIDDGDVPAGDNDHEIDEYDLGAFEMDKWMHLEVEARIGWKNTLAPQLIIRVNGQERLNLQTPIGFNIVSSGGYVNTHFGLYCPQWHDRAYEHTHREILVTNIRWSGTQKEN